VLVEIGDGDVRPFAREEDGDGSTDPGITAGDERHLVVELA
jgi:hypothetical protein